MALVRHTHTAGSELTTEQKARLDEAAKRPINYTKDCPQLTDEQLAEFHPANGMTWEERARAMRAEGIVDPDTVPAEVLANTP
ncbi:hypothetical protein AGMMS49940_02480 [Spirochaetia bacterium]|nr:hypothetical protein AGMMS49940_02480 [Spirochaetia bacterium]